MDARIQIFIRASVAIIQQNKATSKPEISNPIAIG